MSDKNFVGWTIARLIGILILLGLIAAGAYMAYNAGVANGISQAPEVVEAIQQTAENGSPVPPMFDYGYAYPYHHGIGFGHGFGFGIFHFFGFFIFLFFFFGLLRLIFFRGWSHRHHGHWGKWEGNVPPMFDEWHKRAHGEKPAEEK